VTREDGFVALAISEDGDDVEDRVARRRAGPVVWSLPSVATVRRVARYFLTSVAALAISEITLLALVDARLQPTVAALLANLAGALPSYLLSRYWIWAEADRRRPLRQIVLYWVVSVVSMGISSVATGELARLAPASRLAHLVVVGTIFLGVSFVLWVAKYLVYEAAIFIRPAPARRRVAAAESEGARWQAGGAALEGGAGPAHEDAIAVAAWQAGHRRRS